ncbi:hypothetical protein B0H14DRAFT_3021425 [Mycena olivaceomarginata]|nr:hypothetical protein B0H14DRAFT_3021425 [Mycena olivaceomarginata]
MTESVLRIQEVYDELAYHISDPVELKSTALVSRTLCISAQRQLFRHIALDPIVVFNNARSKVEAAAQRLSVILVAKPHLLGCVRHLTVCTPPMVVELLANFQFPMLQKLSLVYTRFFRDLLASPLLREVEVSYVNFEDNPFTPFAFLFETCSPRLESLAFNQISRPQIKTLKLDDATNCGDWFMSPSFPFDFTHLSDVDVMAGDEQRDESLLLFLTSVRLSLTRLVFSNATDINLSDSRPLHTWESILLTVYLKKATEGNGIWLQTSLLLRRKCRLCGKWKCVCPATARSTRKSSRPTSLNWWPKAWSLC